MECSGDRAQVTDLSPENEPRPDASSLGCWNRERGAEGLGRQGQTTEEIVKKLSEAEVQLARGLGGGSVHTRDSVIGSGGHASRIFRILGS